MKRFIRLPAAALICFLTANCNSLYNVKSTRIEVLIPARAVFPPEYKTIAVRYNNSNVAYNPAFAEFSDNGKIITDTTNTDSIASVIHYNSFLETLKANFFFDAVKEITKGQYSGILLSDSLIRQEPGESEDSAAIFLPTAVRDFAMLATRHQPEESFSHFRKVIDPVYGLYTKDELSVIKDTTGADMLLSLDFFAILDIHRTTGPVDLYRDVYVISFWNFYDLESTNLTYFYNRVDTITWKAGVQPAAIPPRMEAIRLASEISGTQFAEFLVPHWTQVERAYYAPWNKELKATNQLIKQGEWKKAAEYWRPYTLDNHPKIAVKSMFNMAVACEMESRIDAAIDWAVRSYHEPGVKNTNHKQMCLEYINILYLRHRDIRTIDFQLNPPYNVPK